MFFYERIETNLVVALELGKKLAGLEEDAGRGGDGGAGTGEHDGGGTGMGRCRHGSAGAAVTWARWTCGFTAKKFVCHWVIKHRLLYSISVDVW
jgi:hypothetical protein